MLSPDVDRQDKRLLTELFGASKEAGSLDGLIMPSGSFELTAVEGLIDRGLARYRVETGISCQGPQDWDLVLTDKGRHILQAEDEERGFF